MINNVLWLYHKSASSRVQKELLFIIYTLLYMPWTALHATVHEVA